MASFADLGGLVAAKSALMSAAVFAVRNYSGNDLYCNPHCAIQLMAESDAAGLARHPYWKDLHHDSSCAGRNEEYIANQNKTTERQLMDWLVAFWTGLGVLLIAKEALSGLLKIRKGTTSLRVAGASALVSVIFGVFSATIFLMHTHYNVDITHLGGGIVHHALAHYTGINDKQGSVSEGYLIFGFFNRVFYATTLYALVTRDARLKECFSPLVLVGLLQVQAMIALRQVGKNHPVYHDMAKDGATPAMLAALPYTTEWRAFKHCITHHDNGLSFSGDFFLDPFWDLFLYAQSFLHNDVLRLQLGSTAHHVFSAAADAAMGAMGAGLLYVLLRVASWFVPIDSSTPAADAAGKGKAKTVKQQ